MGMVGELNARLWEKDLLIGLGFTYLQGGEWEKARDHLERGLAFARDIGTRDEEVEALIGLGELHHCIGDAQAAHDYLGLAEKQAKAQPVMDVIVVWDQGPLSEIEERPIKARPYYDWLSKINCLRARWTLEKPETGQSAKQYGKALSLGYQYNEFFGKLILEEVCARAVSLAKEEPGQARKFLSRILVAFTKEARPEISSLAGDKLVECLEAIALSSDRLKKGTESEC